MDQVTVSFRSSAGLKNRQPKLPSSSTRRDDIPTNHDHNHTTSTAAATATGGKGKTAIQSR
eukprot:2787256-Amphidinium_carterae.1